jgi:hypothetical protein
MAESFLEEQLKRIRELTDRMTRVRSDAAELSYEILNREDDQDPLHNVKDLRKYSYPDREIDRPEDHPAKIRRHHAHEAPRRRRR